MSKRSDLLKSLLVLIGVLIMLTSGCKKEEDNDDYPVLPKVPVLTTSFITNITEVSAVCGGNITMDMGSTVTARGVCWSTNSTPTIADNKTVDGMGAGLFTSYITGLTANTIYYVRSYATNSRGTGYGNTLTFIAEEQIFTDFRDGTVYKFVRLGTQVWMAENLKYLPSVAGPGNGSETNPFYYIYGYNGSSVATAMATANYKTYGVLYNWPAVMYGATSSAGNPSGVQGVCPSGWHLPSDAEWTQLVDFLGGESIAGGKMKSFTGWNSPNTGATNESGFTALPGGLRHIDGTFSAIGAGSNWWTSTEYSTSDSFGLGLDDNDIAVGRGHISKGIGLSVRCVRN